VLFVSILCLLATRPQDGDDAYMDAGAAPLMPVLQHLYDAAGALRIAVLGQMSGGDRLSVDPGGTSTVFAVRVSRVVGLLSRQTGSTPIYATYTAAETVLDLTDVDSSPANLSNSTWYYVYAFCNGTATTAFYISTTAPEASLTWRTGAEGVDRYIGCFRTNASGAPLPVSKRGNRYEYDFGAIGNTDITRVLNAGVSTSFAAVACGAVVPQHVNNVRLRLDFAPNAAGDTYQIRRTGASTFHKVGTAPSTQTHTDEIETLTNSSVQFDYLVSTASASLTARVLGFSE
jgi:hypothetical protein